MQGSCEVLFCVFRVGLCKIPCAFHCKRVLAVAVSVVGFSIYVPCYSLRVARARRTNRTLACVLRTRRARSPQRVARAGVKSHSRLHFAHSTRTISAKGCARRGQIALSPSFRALDACDLRRGLRAQGSNRTLACVSRTRRARSPQRVAFSVDADRPTLRL